MQLFYWGHVPRKQEWGGRQSELEEKSQDKGAIEVSTPCNWGLVPVEPPEKPSQHLSLLKSGREGRLGVHPSVPSCIGWL